MPRIVLAETQVSTVPRPDDHPEIVLRSLDAIREVCGDDVGGIRLVVHTHEGRAFEPAVTDRIPDEAALRSLLRRSPHRPLRTLLEPPVVAMTPSGERSDIDALAREFPEATVVIGGFVEGELPEEVLRIADARVSLGPKLLVVWAVIERVLRSWTRSGENVR